MGVDKLATDGGDDVALGDHNGLAGHRRRLVRGRACLHDLLQMGWEVDKGTRCDLSLVSVDLQVNIV